MTKQKTNNFFLLCLLRKVGFLVALTALVVAFLAHSNPVVAATSSTINFQARLMTSGGAIVPDGYYNVEFKLYNASSSSGSSQGSCTGDASCLWTETRTGLNTVRVANGYLTANLGSVTAFPSTINWDQQIWLSMNIGGTSGSPVWDGPMSPRLLLTSVPYAFTAGQLATMNGSFRSVLSFVQPTANRTIQAPDESGTICLQSSTNCGFAPASGSGNYIQNQNSGDQTANFRISGTGRANTALQAPLFDTATAATLNIGTTNATAINLNKSTTVTGGLTQSGGTVSLSTSGTATATVGSTSGSSTLTLQGGTGSSAITLTTGTNGKVAITAGGSGGVNANIGSNGFIVQTTTNSNTALQVLDSGNLQMFNVNTATGTILLGATQVTYSGLDGVITAPFGKVTLGQTNAATTILGSSSMTLQATSGSFTTSLGFAAPTANRTVTVPNESGTICLQSSTNCGFAPASGSGNYIQNTTSPQSANFYVQAATSGSVAGVIQANASGSGAILQLKNGAGTNVGVISSTGAATFQNSTNSTSGFLIQAAAGGGGNAVLRVDTTNERVAIGVISDPIGAKLSIATGTGVTLRGYQGSTFDAFQLGNATGDFFTVGATGNVLAKQTTNAVNAFQVQNQAGSQLLNIDTTNTVTSLHGGASQLGAWKQTSSTPNSVRYNATASANGYVYSVGGTEAGAKNWVWYAQQNADGSIGSWQTGTSLPVSVYATSVITANNYIYVLGGQTASGVISTVYYATINPSTGAVGTWNTTTALPTTLGWGSATVANGYVYYAAGHNGTTNVSTVYYAQLNAGTGAVGSWTTSGNSLPATRAYQGVFAANGYLYTIGGQDASMTQYTSYYAKINTSGSINAWNNGTSLPVATSQGSLTTSNGYVYVIAGYNGYALSNTYYASIQNIVSIGTEITANGSLTLQSSSNSNNALQVQNSSGLQMLNVNTSDNVVSINTNATTNGSNSAWGAVAVNPTNDYDGVASVEYNGYVYTLGGYDGTNYFSGVYYARTASTGTLGPWKTALSLPGNRAFGSAVVVNGYIYFMGGNNNGTFSGATYYAKINLDGSLGAWQTAASFPSAAVRAYGTAVTANGYIYFMGGRGGGLYQTTTYYAAPAADGSISSWSTGTALPAARAQHASVTANGYIYVLGGTADGTTAQSTSYYASVNPSTGAIGAWNTTTALPGLNMNLSATSANGYVYAVGGYNGTNILNTISYATLNADGTLGSWQTSAKSMPTGSSFGSSLAAQNNYLYVFGGYNGFTFNSYVYATSLGGLMSFNGNLSVNGSATFQPGSSTTAFQVQNSSGGQMLNIDTVNNAITLHGNNSGQISSWKAASSLAASTSFAGATIANGYAYLLGGYGSGYQATTQYAKINPDGTMTPWQTTTALPAARAYVSSVSATGYIYAMGGTPGSGSVDTIYIGKQSPDGPITAWQTSNVNLPQTMNAMATTVANGYLYVLGGTNGSALTNTYYSRLNGDGAVNTFQAGTALPVALANAQTVVANGYIYFIGGYTGSTAVSTVYYAPLNATTGAIGSWTATTSMPVTANNFGATVSNGYLYVYRTGGVYYAPLNSDGTVGNWTQSSSSIPVNYNGISALTYNGYNYVLGGYTGSVGTTGVYYTSGARTYVAGTLDLVGLTMKNSGATDDGGGAGATGGALIAGNTSIVGSLQVQGQSSFAQNVSITGNLTLGDDRTDSDTVLTLASRNYSGIHLLGDMGNTGGEIGGAYVLYVQDGWSVSSITGTVQTAGLSPQGDTYTNTLGNAYLVGNYNNAAVQLGTNSTVRLTVTGGGSVCIAVTSCTKTLGVSGTIGASGAITANTTPDLAETIPAAPDVEAADVVMADPENTERVVKSDRAYNAAAVGVISDGSSSFMINSYGGSADAPLTGAPLVLAGRVPVKVTDEGGSIRPGDALTSASKRGYAMKANRAGPTIGIALGSFNKASGTVLVLVKVGYYDPTPGVQGANDSVNYENLNITGDALVNRLIVNSVTVNGPATIKGDLTVRGATSVGAITINGHIISGGELPLLTLDNNVGKNATISGSGNDISGTVVVTTGADPQPGKFIHLEFRKAYERAPRVVLSANGRESAVAQPYVDSVSETGFVIGITQVPATAIELRYTYQVIQ